MKSGEEVLFKRWVVHTRGKICDMEQLSLQRGLLSFRLRVFALCRPTCHMPSLYPRGLAYQVGLQCRHADVFLSLQIRVETVRRVSIADCAVAVEV